MASGPRPRRSMTSGRKFSTTISALATSRSATERSAADFRSSTRLRLPRWSMALAACFQRGPPGGSTRTTSAPWSASMTASNGPARYWPKSSTRILCSAPLTRTPGVSSARRGGVPVLHARANDGLEVRGVDVARAAHQQSLLFEGAVDEARDVRVAEAQRRQTVRNAGVLHQRAERFWQDVARLRVRDCADVGAKQLGRAQVALRTGGKGPLEC